MYVEVDISGYERAAEIIDKLTARIENRDDFARTKLGKILGRSFERAFNTQGQTQGSMWAFHSEATKRRDGQHRVLVLSGRLRRSLVIPHGTDNRMKITPDSFSYGSGVWYGKMVSKKRPFARLGRQDVDAIENALRDYIADTENML